MDGAEKMASLTAAEIIARVIGPLYVIVALGMLFNAEPYRRMAGAFFETPALTYLGGVTALAAGLIILTFHYDWSSLFAGLITLLGWLAVLKGTTLLVAPRLIERVSGPLLKSAVGLPIGGVVALIIGLYLSLKGYRIF